MKKFTNFIVKYRWVVLVVTFMLTIFFGFQLKSLKVDSNIVDSLPKNDSVVKTFKEVGKQFGGNEMGMIILKDKNILKPEALSDIREITDTLSEMKGVASVTSLTNIMNINVKGDNFQVSKLINNDNWPDNQERADSLKKEILANKMVAGNLISRDGSSTLIIFTFQDGANILKVSQTIKNKMGRLHLHEKYYFAGSSFMTNDVSDVISKDLVTLIPISFLLIALILFLSFHSLRGVVLPLLTAGFAIIWAMGIFSMLGFKLSMVSNNVPIIILAVGSAYVIHVLNRVNQCKEKDSKKAIAKALSLITVPVILAALTTMVGFLSFIFGSYLTMIRDFGLLAALGTFLSALLALIFVPAVLAVWPEKAKGKVLITFEIKGSVITRYILMPLYKMVRKYRYAVLLVWVILFAVSIAGIFMIKRNVRVSGYFKKNNPATIVERIINEKFGGTNPVFAVFKGNMQEPAVLKAMFQMETFLKSNPNITGTQSIADIVAQLNHDMGGKDNIPDNKRMIEQLWFLIDQQGSISRLVTNNLDEGIIIAKFNEQDGNNMKAFKKSIQNYISKHTSKSYSIQVTGMPFINAELDKSLVRSQLASVAIAIILIIGIVSLMVSSFIKGLFGSLPILATLAILFGIMGLTGIPLNIATVLVASIAMGIGIDYSIHFISHFNHSKKRYQEILPAIQETFLVSGKAIIINFISVSAGFLVLMFSELVPMIYFGFLIAFSMFGSALGTLTLLPSIMLIGNKKFVNHNKTIKNNEN